MSDLGAMVVKFSADISGLSLGVSKAKEEISSLGSASEKASIGISSMEKSAQQSAQKISNLGSAAHSASGNFLSGTGSMIGGLVNLGAQVGMTVFGIQSLYSTITSVGGSLLNANASMEQTQVAFTSLLHSSTAAGDYLKQLWNFAATTPFEFNQVTGAAQQMIAFGFNTKEVIPDLTAMGNALSAMGNISGEAVQHMTMIFGQMHAAGKIHAGDMMQMTSMGIPAWQMLATAMHLSVAQVMDLSSKGLIPADKAIRMLLDGMNKSFGGTMVQQSQTFNGLISTLHDNVEGAWRAFSGPLFDKAKEGLVQLGNLVSSSQFQQFAQTMGKDVAGALQIASSYAQILWKNATLLVEKFIAWNEKTHFLQNLLSDLSMLIRRVAGNIHDDILPPLQLLVLNLWNAFQNGGSFHSVLQKLGDAFSIVTPIVGTLVDWLAQVVSWFQQGGTAADLLQVALIGVGIAIATIKIVELSNNLMHMVTVVIPQVLAKYGLWAGAADAVAVSEVGVGTAATGAAVATETATVGMGAGFTAMLGPIGLVAAAIVGLTALAITVTGAKTPGTLLPSSTGGNTGLSVPGFGGRQSQMPADVLAQQAKAADALKLQLDGIKQGWKDMIALYTDAESKGRILGNLLDPHPIDAADLKVINLKAHLDDLAKPRIIGVLTPQVEAARLKVIEFKTHLDDLKGPFAPSIGTRSVDDAMLKVINLKSHLDDLGGTSPTISPPISIGVHPHASGGVIAPYTYGTAGEQGTELLYGGSSGISVMDASRTAALGGGGGDIHNYFIVDGEQLAYKIMTRADQMARAKYGPRGRS